MEIIRINNKLYVEKYGYADRDRFHNICEMSQEINYWALESIWNKGIEVWLIYKKAFFRCDNVGFISIIDCDRLLGKERLIMDMFRIPTEYNGIFINDMRISILDRNRGIGTKVVNILLEEEKTYLLEPVEDGKWFWKKFGFVEKGGFEIKKRR